MDNETKDILQSIKRAIWVLAVSGVIAIIVLLLIERWMILAAILSLFKVPTVVLMVGALIIAGLIVAYYSAELITPKKDPAEKTDKESAEGLDLDG